MTQQELDEILSSHKIWLDSQGQKGQQANFDNEFIHENYDYDPQYMRVNVSKGGGIEAVHGSAIITINDKEVIYTPSHFTNLNFNNADLRGAIFNNALFYKCNMEKVNFGSCDLSKSTFAEANLKSARFGGFFEPFCNLKGVTFVKCNLTKNFLQQQDISGSELSGTDFSDSNMHLTNFSNSILKGANFESVTLSQANFTSCSMQNTKFISSDLSSADISLANLKLATFDKTNIAGLKCKFKGYIERLKEAFIRKPEQCYIGCRVETAYGNERLKKAIREQSYTEETAFSHPHWYKLWILSSDCGRSMRLWSLWSAIIALSFAFIFYLIGTEGFTFNKELTKLVQNGDFFSFIYYSIVTFTTLGFGDITPINRLAMFIVICEVITGFIMLGLLISILANKVASRS